MSGTHESGPDSRLRRSLERDRLCDRFEAECRAGQWPRIEAYLDEVAEADRPALLRELLLIELDRLGPSELIEPETYFTRFGAWPDVVHGVFAELGSEVWQGLAPAPADDRAGFRIVSVHSQGGLGVVYVAQDDRLGRTVALKEIQPALANDPALRKRFDVEAKLTSRLEHPGVVPVYAAGHRAGGEPYYVTKLVRGVTLREAIAQLHAVPVWTRQAREHPGGVLRLLRRFLAVCQTVAYAHSVGVVHRDLKPDNILLGNYGETIVIDWGLAKPRSGEGEPGSGSAGDDPMLAILAWERGDITAAGAEIGTAIYASPEQLRGDSVAAGPLSDVYSLGATLYHIITGRPPYDPHGPRDELRACVLAGSAPPPRAVHRGIPPALEAICRKAMAAEPDDRYATPGALEEDLANWIDREPVGVYPERLPAKVRRWARRHRAVTAALLLLLTGCLGFGIASFVAAVQTHRATLQVLKALDRVTLATVPDLYRWLRADKDHAIRGIDAFLTRPDVPESQRRIVALVRLGLNPTQPAQVHRDLASSPSWSREVVEALLARPPFDVRLAADLRELLRPVYEDLLPEFRAVLRGLQGTQSGDTRERAGMAARAIAADRPEQLVALIPDLPEKVLLQVVEQLRPSCTDELLSRLRSQLAETLHGWPEQPPDPSWSPPAEEWVRELEGADGWVDSHFLFCQSLDLERWPKLVDALRPAGYRPFRARPYRAADGRFRLAGLWARDGLETVAVTGLDAAAVQATDTRNRGRGLALVDVAGYAPDDSGALQYVAGWSASGGAVQETWRRNAEFAYQLGWEGWPFARPVVRFELGLTPDEAREREQRSWPRPDWVPWTVQLAELGDGSIRLTRSWALIPGMDTALSPTFEPAAAIEDRLHHGLVPRDLSVAFDRTEAAGAGCWLGATWTNPSSIESRIIRDSEPRLHLAEAKELAAEGYRPAAIAVNIAPSGPLAASLWHRPADVSQDQAVRPERTLRIATALYHLGDRQPLMDQLRRSADPTVRFLFADRAPRLGLSARELLEWLRRESDPGVVQALLLAIGSYEPAQLVQAGVFEAVEWLRELGLSTDAPGVRSSASWLCSRFHQGSRAAASPAPGAQPTTRPGRHWIVNSQGTTLAIVPGPVDFVMGESRIYPAEPEGIEARHRVRIPRSFALQTTEVTVSDFQEYQAARAGATPSRSTRVYPEQPDVPVTGVSLAEVARFANWLNRREGIPEDQWCFVEDGNRVRLASGYLSRLGYRLPTEAEWEYACRAGTSTTRPFGRGLAASDPLVARHSWYLLNSTGRVHPTGWHWPNDLGLFDVLGNVRELCLNARHSYCKGHCEQRESDVEEEDLVLDRGSIVTRGGSVESPETGLFSSHRTECDRQNVPLDVGFRLARTLSADGPGTASDPPGVSP